MKKTSILYTHPEIVKDWDYISNVNLRPEYFSKTSKESVWWICPMGHKYLVSIYSRIRSNGCKICNMPSKSENIRKSKFKKSKSFSELYPELLKEWNYSKNHLNPTEVSGKSQLPIWFKCINNHEWKSSASRRSRGEGCPECYKLMDKSKLVREQKLKKKGSTLADEFPELVKEWDFDKNAESPMMYSSGSNALVSWKCNFGHKWDATIYNRTGNSSGCPLCKSSTSKLEVFILTEMRKLFKDVKWRHKIEGYECDIYIPEINTGIEVDGAYWHDEKIDRDRLKNKVFKQNNIRLIRVRDESLPKIIGDVILYNKRSSDINLSCKVVELISEYNKNNSLDNYLKDKIQLGREEYNKILSLLPSPTEEDSLAQINPSLSKDWDFDKNAPLTPYMFSPNSEKKVYWLCKKGHSYEASIKMRNSRNSGCPICYAENRSEIVRKGRLKKSGILFGEVFPELLTEWDYEKNTLSPFEVAPKSKLVVWWICPNSHQYKKSIMARACGNDCPECSSQKRSISAREVRIKKTGTLKEVYPEIVNQWDYEKNKSLPKDFPPGSSEKVWWLCSLGHSWKTSIAQRTVLKHNCPICAKMNSKSTQLKSAINRLGSLEELNPAFLSEWDFEKNNTIKPSELTLNNKTKVWWLCKNQHSYFQSPSDRNNGHGCPICAKQKKIDSYLSKILDKRGSLKDNNPELLEYWDYDKNTSISPDKVTSGSHIIVWWKCEHGHEWNREIKSMTRKKNKGVCPYC